MAAAIILGNLPAILSLVEEVINLVKSKKQPITPAQTKLEVRNLMLGYYNNLPAEFKKEVTEEQFLAQVMKVLPTGVHAAFSK